MKAFWEPPTRTSIPSSSNGREYTPTAVMPSTMRSTSSLSFVRAAIFSVGCLAPVDVSLACIRTALTEGSFSSFSSIVPGATVSPHSTFISSTSSPHARAIFPHLSPNFPPFTTITLSPALSVFETAPSMAPVPDAARMNTSPPVWKISLSPSLARSKTASNSAVLWWMSGLAISTITLLGTETGPGVRSSFFICRFSSWKRGIERKPIRYTNGRTISIAPAAAFS